MKLEELNERGFVFFKETIEKLLTPDCLMLGCIIYSRDLNFGLEGRKNIFPANIVYINEEGVLMLANDYFYNAGIQSFDSRTEGISAGHYFDNWSDSDVVVYSEKQAPVPEELRKAIEDLNPEEAGILRQDYLDEINKLLEIYQAETTMENLILLDNKISEFFVISVFGEKYNSSLPAEHFCGVKFTADEESIKEVLTFKNSKFKISGINYSSTNKDDKFKISFTSSDSNTETLAGLTESGQSEFLGLIEDQSFQGPRTFKEDFDNLDTYKKMIQEFDIKFTTPASETSSKVNKKMAEKEPVAQEPGNLPDEDAVAVGAAGDNGVAVG